MKPCCDKDKSGQQCHIKPALLNHTKRLTRNDSNQMAKEHDAYKYAETKLFGSSGLQPSAYDISRRLALHGLDTIKDERAKLYNIIQMRTDWLNKWYVPPTTKSDCYTCDANARNHNMRIVLLKRSLDDYDKITKEKITQERPTPVRLRPKLNFTRKKNNVDKVDPIARRQILAAMLAKRQITQKLRRKSSSNRRKSSSNRRKTASNSRVRQ